MAGFLRQSTVSTVKVGPAVAPGDALTPFTGGGFTVKISKAGGALAARNDSTAITHDADGYYPVELNATDTATLGQLRAEVPGSTGNYLPFWEDFTVLSQVVYDSLFGTVALSTYAGGAVASVAAGVALTAAGMDLVVVETGLNARQALAIACSAVAGKLTGAAGPTTVTSAAGVPGTTRISAAVDATGRTAVTLTPPA
jgi:hypothetical protein